jgi:copper(I)-binding protein
MTRTFWQLAVALGFALAAFGQVSQAASVVAINAPWVRPAQAGKTTQAYFSLRASEGGRLIGAESPRAVSVTLDDPKSGKPMSSVLTLPRGAEVAFAPGKVHLTLHELRQSLKLGERVPFTLTIESVDGVREIIPVDAEVRNESPIDAERKHHHKAGVTAP